MLQIRSTLLLPGVYRWINAAISFLRFVAELSRKRRTVPHAYNALKHGTKQLIRYLREEWHCKIGRVANYQGDEKRERRARRRKQGLKFRRNFAEFRRNFSFPLGTGKKYFGIFGKFRFENSKFKKNCPKFTEIRRNSAKFRNGIPFPPITGISPENEMVNPTVDPRRKRANAQGEGTLHPSHFSCVSLKQKTILSKN